MNLREIKDSWGHHAWPVLNIIKREACDKSPVDETSPTLINTNEKLFAKYYQLVKDGGASQ
jgi:hypothetical protein